MSKANATCKRIRAATTESQVMAAVREYLSSLGPPEVAGIPLHIVSTSLVMTEESLHTAIQAFEDALGAVGVGDGDAAEGTRVVLTTAARRLAALNGNK